jgi:PAS domain S-box-containing protein
MILQQKKMLEIEHQETLQSLKKVTFDLQVKIRETEALFQNLSEGVVVYDADGRIIQFNQAALDILGLNANQIQALDSFTTFWHAVREDGQPFPQEEHPAACAIRQGQCQTNVMMGIQRSPDDMRWIMINAAPIYESGIKEVSRSLTTFRDITDQRQQEALLIHASKLSSLGELSAAIAHEINNPLTIISGRVQQLQHMLESTNLNPELICQSLGKIQSNVLRMHKIISGLRSFSRNSADDPMECFAVKTLVDNTLTLCQANFDEYHTQLQVLPQAEGSSLECRSSQITQVLLNLLNNALDAVKANPEGERFVQLEYSEDADSITLSVSDNGPGITPPIRNKIMDAFYTTKPPGQGTGLGLSISQSIVKKHQGTLILDPSGAKTRFVVNLPKKQKHVPLAKATA